MPILQQFEERRREQAPNLASPAMNSSAVHDVPGAAPAVVAESAVQTAELNGEQQHAVSNKTKHKKDKKEKAVVKAVSIRKLFSLADETDKVHVLSEGPMHPRCIKLQLQQHHCEA
jgi:hypothetical protein